MKNTYTIRLFKHYEK